MKIGRSYTFAAAHHLPNVPPGHKCGNVHGHTYTLDVELEGEPNPVAGWLIDFADLDALVKRVVLLPLDHTDLNDTFPNPTSELLVVWIWEMLSAADWPVGVGLQRVRLSESAYSWAEIEW